MSEDALRRKMSRMQQRIDALEAMIEDSTRELFLANERLRMAAEYLREIYRAMPGSLIVFDRQGRVEVVNDAALKLFGYAENEIIGHPIAKLFETKDVPDFPALEAALVLGPVVNVEKSCRAKDGTVIEVLFWATLLPDDNAGSAPRGVVSIVMDVRDRKQLEAQLRQAQKMESLGVIAGGIAHDFNNILMPILTYSDMLTHEPDPKTVHQFAERIMRSANRAKGLVQQILNFSRKKASNKIVIPLTATARDAVDLIRAGLSSTVDVTLDMDDAPCHIIGDKTQIHQILLNLCTNAAQAMPGGGKLALAVHRVRLGDMNEAERAVIHAHTCVRLSVSDTGIGIPLQVLPRIFEPFFTTKNVGEGTGMGLSVVHGIVKSHGGVIAVQSDVGKGTTFTISFPVADGAGPSHETRRVDRPHGREHILLVDDEIDVREASEAILVSHGYTVTACDAKDGLKAFAAAPADFDAAIVDYAMPDMNGIQLGERLLAVRRNFPIIMCSGYSSDVNADDALRHGMRDYLAKPAAAGELLSALRKALDTSVAGGAYAERIDR